MGFLDKFISKEAQDKIKSAVKTAAEIAEEKIKEAAEEKKASSYSPAAVAQANGEEYTPSSDAPRLINKHRESVIPFAGVIDSGVSKKNAADYIEDLVLRNFPGVTVKRDADFGDGSDKKFVPVSLLLEKDSRPVLAVIVCGKNQYRLYGVINTMNACEQQGIPAIRFFREFENKPEYVCGRIKAVAKI